MTRPQKSTNGSCLATPPACTPPTTKGPRRQPWSSLLVAVAFSIGAACGNPKETTGAATASTNSGSAVAPASTPSQPEAGFQKLVGRWLRPDGGYVLEISGVDTAGKATAAYLNPRPINVARAEASRDGTFTKLFVELRDVNYPGSTYTLTYEPKLDQLQGIYFQAALQQQFDVVFERMK